MLELADIFCRYGQKYRAKYEKRMLPSHLQAMWDIEHCRTEDLGGKVYFCDNCEDYHYSYHSCKNRHCPKCQNDDAQQWLEKQKELLLPTGYFLVTFTLPDELRKVARSNQKTTYGMLFRTSAEALKKLALDPGVIGGEIGMVGVLQTWTRDLSYHLHIHYIVPGGGLSPEGNRWLPSNKKFLVPVEALSIIFRAKFRDELKKTDLFDKVSSRVWKKDWVVHSEGVGSGEEALKYIAPYVYRIALTNNRLVKLKDDKVTFRYKDSHTNEWKYKTLPALEFIHRFLQHVLPKGFMKIRYYGFLSPGNRNIFEKIKCILGPPRLVDKQKLPTKPDKLLCPKCGGELSLVERIKRHKRGPPYLN